MARLLLLPQMVAFLVACGSETAESPVPAPADEQCPAPNRLVGERCLEPGVQDNGCPAATLGLADGSCQPAGVPPAGCAEGFVHDGEYGCEPILPAEPCPDGLMAVPGDAECRPVMACGEGQWGDIPVDATTVYVDAAYTGGSSDGSAAQPFTTIGAAVAAAADGALIAVAAGTYAEDVLLQRRVRLWDVCPEQAVVTGAGLGVGAIDIQSGASGTEVRGLAIASSTNIAAVGVSGAESVLLAQLWVHDAAGRGFDVESTLGPTSVTAQGCLIERSHFVGVLVFGAEVTLEGLVVRDTLPQQSDQQFGRGINIQPHLTSGAPSSAVVSGTLVERSHDLGVFVAGSEVTLEGLVVRDTLPRQSDQQFGHGIELGPAPDSGDPASAVVRRSLVEGSHDVGVFVAGSEATLEGVVVRDTLPQQSDQRHGRGIAIQADLNFGTPGSAVVTGSLVERSHDLGVFVSGSEVALEGLVVRDTVPQQNDQLGGRGINIQAAVTSGAPSSAVVTGSLVERSHDLGLCVSDSEARLEGLVVRTTLARLADGQFGDGLVVVSEHGPARAVIAASWVTESARAGLASFGAEVTLGGSALNCNNAFDLTGELFLEQPFVFEDLGGNGCGCPEPSGACKAISAGLAPPESVDDR